MIAIISYDHLRVHNIALLWKNSCDVNWNAGRMKKKNVLFDEKGIFNPLKIVEISGCGNSEVFIYTSACLAYKAYGNALCPA